MIPYLEYATGVENIVPLVTLEQAVKIVFQKIKELVGFQPLNKYLVLPTAPLSTASSVFTQRGALFVLRPTTVSAPSAIASTITHQTASISHPTPTTS